jgi:hypothetical protein
MLVTSNLPHRNLRSAALWRTSLQTAMRLWTCRCALGFSSLHVVLHMVAMRVRAQLLVAALNFVLHLSDMVFPGSCCQRESPTMGEQGQPKFPPSTFVQRCVRCRQPRRWATARASSTPC